MGWKKISQLFSQHRGGIRRRLLWIGLLFLALALLTNTIAGSLYTRAQIKKAAAELQAEVASRVAREIEEFMRHKTERLLDLSTSASLHPLGSEGQRILALLLLKNDISFTEVAVLNDKGREVLKVSERRIYHPLEQTDQSKTEWFKKAAAGGNYISQVYTSDTAEPYVSMAVPIRIGPNRIIGVLSGEVNLRFLWQIIGDVKFGKAGYAYLVDGQGNLIAHQDHSLVLKRKNLSHIHKIRAFLKNPKMTDPTPGEDREGIMSQSVLSTFAPVRGLGWAVVLEEPTAAALADLNTMVQFALLLLLVGLLVGAVILFWFSGKMTKPILELHRGAEIIGGGHLDHRVKIQTGDEIEELAEGFNKMAAELKTSYSTLEQKVEQRTQELERLNQEIRQHLESLKVLISGAQKLSGSLDLPQLAEDVVRTCVEVFGMRLAWLGRAEPDGRVVQLAYCPPEVQFVNEIETRWDDSPQGQGAAGQAIRAGQPLVSSDITTEPVLSPAGKAAIAQGYRSRAALPLISRNRPFGVLVLFSDQLGFFTQDRIQLLQAYANQAGAALENARLFEEVKNTSQGLEALVRINRDVAELLERNILLPRIAEEATRILGVDGVSFRLVEGEDLVQAGYTGADELSGLPQKVKIGESLTGRVVKGNRIIAIKNLLEDQMIIPEHREILTKAGYRSYLGVPLRVGDRVIGSINFYSKREREFRPEETRLISAFADQAAIAVENANLFAEVKSKSAELQEINRELQAASRAKSDFLAAMSHELRTPLNVIIGNADIIKDGYMGEVTKKQKEAMEKILRYSHMLLKLINNVLSLSRMEAKKMSLDLSTFHVREVIEHAKTFVEQLNGNKRLEILWQVEPNLPPVTTDALKLEEILQNLIGNAFKFTPKGSIEIRVRDIPGKDRLEFAVADTGIGINKKDMDKIFEQFQQLKDAHTGNYSGVGLGLNIVKNYLELMQGEIWVESEPGIGSTFTFTLPYSVELPSD